MEAVDDADDSHGGGHAHSFTLVRARKKNMKVKQYSSYKTRSKVGSSASFKLFVFFGILGDWLTPPLGKV